MTWHRSPRSRLRDRILGDDRHVGLWILPLFMMAALLGAVLVGGLATLYYSQQVRDLEATTVRARRDLDRVVADVSQSATQARSEITEQVNQARDEFSRASPITSPPRAGVYAVTARHRGGEVRVGSAFTVFSNDTETFLLTTYALVDDGQHAAVKTVDVLLPEQTVTVSVHSFDRERDLSVLTAQGGPLPVLEWRPVQDPVSPGDAVYAAGIAGPDTPAVLQGRVAGSSALAVVPDVPVNSFLAGGPLVDGAGRVVAVTSLEYAPFGAVDGTLVYAPPIRLSCEVLIDCTAADVGADSLREDP